MKDKLSMHAHWFLRVALASVFLFHGAEKLMNLQATADMMQMPFIVTTLVACAEFFGGLFVFVGGFTKDIVTRVGGAFHRNGRCNCSCTWLKRFLNGQRWFRICFDTLLYRYILPTYR